MKWIILVFMLLQFRLGAAEPAVELLECDDAFESKTKTVCGDCATLEVRNNSNPNSSGNYNLQITCSKCKFNIPADEVFTTLAPKSPINWGLEGCTMFRWQYIPKHPVLSSVMIAIVLFVIWIAFDQVYYYWKSKTQSDRITTEYFLSSSSSNTRRTHSSQGDCRFSYEIGEQANNRSSLGIDLDSEAQRR